MTPELMRLLRRDIAREPFALGIDLHGGLMDLQRKVVAQYRADVPGEVAQYVLAAAYVCRAYDRDPASVIAYTCELISCNFIGAVLAHRHGLPSPEFVWSET